MRKLKQFGNLVGPMEGLRALAEHAPQAEAFAERQFERARPLLDWVRDARRRLATVGVLLLTAWLFIHVVFGANGMVVYRQKRVEHEKLQREVEALQEANKRYSEKIKALETDPKMIEKEAREQLHYVRPGEVVYVPPPVPATQTPNTKPPQK